VAGSVILIGDIVSAVFFPAFGAVFPISNTFNVCGKIISRMVDNKRCTGFVDITGDGCQGDGLRSLTCVMFQAGRKVG